MSSLYAEEIPFEAKFTNFREEVLSFGVPLNTPITAQKLFEILDSKIVDKQFGGEIIGNIYNYMDKSMHPNFTLAQFFDGCLRFRKAFLEKVETAQMDMAKFQNEKNDAEQARNKANQQQQENEYGDKSNRILNLEVNGLQGLNIPNSRSVFVKLSCYNMRFVTNDKQYSDQVSWKDKFPFEIQTGFERVDVTVVAAAGIPQEREEVIGTAQIHVSSIKDPKYFNEWMNLYSGWSLTPVGRVRLGIEIISSKAGYLDRMIQKLDEHITKQISEIEEYERRLKGFNGLIIPPRNSICQSPSVSLRAKQGFTSPGRRTMSECNSIRDEEENEKCFRTILEEEDGESSANTSAEMLQLPSITVNYNSTPNPKVKPVETPRNLSSPPPTMKKTDSLNRLSERTSQNQVLVQQQKLMVYTQEGEIRGRSPFGAKQKSEQNVITLLNKESLNTVNTNSSLETQSHSHSINSEISKNLFAANEFSDKDAVINYLQKKLNEATRENEHLNNLIVGLQSENQKLKMENTQIPEFQAQVQDYEEKICMLLDEVQKLDQLANQRRLDSYSDSQDDNRVLKNSSNQARYNNNAEYNQTMQILNDSLKMPRVSPISKTPEISINWQQLPRENQSPFQSPREAGPIKSSMRRNPSGILNQTETDRGRRVRDPVKIFPEQRSGSQQRKEFVRPAY